METIVQYQTITNCLGIGNTESYVPETIATQRQLNAYHNRSAYLMALPLLTKSKNLEPPIQGDEDHSGPESIVGAIKDGDELSDIV